MSSNYLTADNGVSSGVTGITQSAGNDGTLQIRTTTSGGTATTAVTIDNTQVATFANTLKAPNLQGPAFSAYATSNSQTIATTTFTKIQFTAKEFDTANCFDSTTNYRFTPTVAGYYQVNMAVGFNAAALGLCLISIFKNGSRFKDGAEITNSNNGPICVASALIYFNGTTDYVEGFGYQSSGGNLTVSVNAGSAGFFQGVLVRSA